MIASIAKEVYRLKEEGRSFSAIGDTLGITRDKARRLYSTSTKTILPDEPLLAEWLRPVEKPAPKSLSASWSSARGIDVILSDFHFPKSCKASEAIALTTIKLLQPARVILNGDLWDLMAFSKFDTDYRQQFHWTPQDEADAGVNFLYRLEEVLGSTSEVVALPGNHEARWWKYLNTNCPQVVAMNRAAELLDFKKWWVPAWSRLKMIEDDIILLPESHEPLLYTHGEIVRAGGGISARAHGSKYHSSVVHGHTHRVGSSVARIPGLGSRPETLIRSYETGCMCDLQPMYSKKPDWTNGFAIVQHDVARGSWSLDQVVITGEKAMVNTLGMTIAA